MNKTDLTLTCKEFHLKSDTVIVWHVHLFSVTCNQFVREKHFCFKICVEMKKNVYVFISH